MPVFPSPDDRSSKRRCLEGHSTETYDENLHRSSPISVTSVSPTSIMDVAVIDDIFLNIAQFFVSKESIDVKSTLSMMQVSKRWNAITTSQRLWNQIPRLKSKPNDDLQTRLIRYKKIERISSDKCYKVQDRATKQVLRLEINSLQRKRSGEENGYLKRHLREVRVLRNMEQICSEFKGKVSLIHFWEIGSKYAIHLYELPEDTLQSYLQKYDLRTQPNIIKGIIHQIFQGVNALHQCSLSHRNLSLNCIHLYGVGSGRTVPLVKIAGFEHCRKNHDLDADNCNVWIPLDRSASNNRNEIDIDAIAHIFFMLTQEQNNQNGTTISKDGSICLDGLDKIIGSDGLNLLKIISCEHHHPKISASAILEHNYFKDITSGTEGPIFEIEQGTKSSHGLQEPLECSADYIIFEPAQASAMVDWLFEIASVFHVNTRTVFVAVGYYNRCCQHLIMERIFGRRIRGIKRYQLLAATCLYIASKCEDDFHVNSNNLSFAADRTFHEHEVMALEHQVLDAIEWNLSMPNIYDFAMTYMDNTKVKRDSELFWLTLYMCEIALGSTLHYEFHPSIIAASISILARYSTHTQPFSTLEIGTNPTLSDCLFKLSAFLETRRVSLEPSMIDKRYSKLSRKSVKKICIKTIQSTTQLAQMEELNLDV